MLSKTQLDYLKRKGLSPAEVKKQLNLLKKKNTFLKLIRPATLNDGIVNIKRKQKKYLDNFNALARQKTILKFVPASGAATRMFQVLIEIKKNPKIVESNKEYKKYLDDFISRLSGFAFYNKLRNKDDLQAILKEILTKEHFDYLDTPKGLIEFHKYYRENRTAFEEHLIEAVEYTKDKNRFCRLHFTILSEHQKLFSAELRKIKTKLEKRFKIKYKIEFSFQDHKTDTICLNGKNKLFIEDNGKPLLRPSGHGALLANLNKLNADIVVIKNIDNVTQDWLKPEVVHEEQMLIAYFQEIQTEIFEHINSIQHKTASLYTLKRFLINTFHYRVKDIKKINIEKVYQILNRPLRICAMVKNDGDPGGGPFWVKGKQGQVSLQIVESAQVAPSQRSTVLAKASHFNPVNIVCGLKDWQGRKYELTNYIDEEAVIITKKFKNGQPLKVLERPGLWNGAMSQWNTIFVETAKQTFAPVKTLNDLLRPEHQEKRD